MRGVTICRMSPQKWKLLSVKDVSPNKWFPVEMRTYQLPNGKIVDDFTVTTLADVAMIVPVTPDEKIVLVRQFKPGFGDILLEFPAGRMETHHENVDETARHELEEETGIRATNLQHFATIAPFVTKGTEKVFCYFAMNVSFNSEQHLDETEDIEVVVMNYQELEKLIYSNELQGAATIAAWTLAKQKFAHKFKTWR